jgi:hypothetical protein
VVNFDILGLTSLVIGIVSFVASIVFFILGSRAERSNSAILEKINEAIQSWQKEMMSSNIELLNSRVEIVGKNVALEESKTKSAFIAALSDRVKHIVENQAPDGLGPAQSHILGQLLSAFESATRSTLTPEMMAQVVAENLKRQRPGTQPE